MKFFFYLSFFLFLNFYIRAQTIEIKGHIKDAAKNESLAGGIIYIKEIKQGIAADEKGEFKFKRLAEGTYTIVAKYIGFDSVVKVINTTKAKREKKKDEEPEIEVNFLLRANDISLKEVEIKRKRDNETDENSRYKEKNGDQVINVVGARTIELSPDITAANVLQRVSGVTLERSAQGDGRYAIVRGMDQRYNNTLINGCKIPSPDPYNRYVPLDIIPSELLQKIEVYKSITPDMEGDAIGGTVNMQMKDAPDELMVHVNMFTGYSNLLWSQPFQAFDKSTINKIDPTKANPPGYVVQPGDFTRKNLEFYSKPFTPYYSGGLVLGKRFLHNKLGVILSGTMQNEYTTSNNQRYFVAPHLDGTPYATDGYNRTFYDHTIRSGFNGKVDYQIDSKNSISFTNVYLNLQDIQSRFTSDTSLTTFRVKGANGTSLGTGQVFLNDRSLFNTQAIETAILNGRHKISHNISISWTGLYSIATSKTPDQAEVNRDFLIDSAYHHSATYFDGATRIWQYNTDKDISGSADLEYKPIIGSKLFEFKTGGLFRAKSRVNYLNDFELRNTFDSTQKTKAVYSGIENAQWTVFSHGYGDYGTNNYDANEEISAYYAQMKTNFGALQVLAGFRMENTQEGYTTHAPVTQNAGSATITYSDFLPNVQLRYKIDNKQNLRFAIYRSLARPSYFDLVPYSIQGNNYKEMGNPYLLHTQATNMDLRYELYPSAHEELLAGVFYKKLQNPIETILETTTDPYNPVLTYSSDGIATNYGFELAVIKYFGHFGFNANYTFTSSSITTAKAFADTTIGKEISKEERHPLQGQSKHVANLAVLYQDQKMGLNIELAYQFTGKRISEIGQFYGTDYYQQDLSQLDFSADKKLGKHFGAFVKVNNLLNSPYVVKLTNGFQVEKNYFGLSYLFGFTYKIN